MKTLLTTFCLIIFILGNAPAQIIDAKETAKRKAENRANNKIDSGIDKGFDKIEEGIGSIFKKKKKGSKNGKSEEEENERESNSEEDSTEETPKAVKKKASARTNSKYDFEAGNKEVFFDDFDRVAVGDFPIDVNTNSGGEVMNVDEKNGKWLGISKNGTFLFDALQNIPENSTLQFELGVSGESDCSYGGFGLKFFTQNEDEMDIHFADGSYLTLNPGSCSNSSILVRKDGNAVIENTQDMADWDLDEDRFAKIEIWRQNGRIRVYINEQKEWDIPRFFSEKEPYSLAFFRYTYAEAVFLIGNVRLAKAGEDNRSKLLTEGRFSTNEILFDVNSDKIKPVSNDIIKEIGDLLVENAGVKIKIIGHTDSDGDANTNLSLSKKRADAVKMRLVYGFGIDENRITTDGKGETEPLNDNKTAEDKAQNRRVEFIKL